MAGFYRARTFHATYLSIRDHDGLIVHGVGQAGSREDVASIYISEHWPGLAFLISDQSSGLYAHTPGYNWAGTITPLGLRRRIDTELVSLSDPATGLFLSVPPADVSEVIDTRENESSWEQFTLLKELDVPVHVTSRADELERLADAFSIFAKHIKEKDSGISVSRTGTQLSRGIVGIEQRVRIDAGAYVSALKGDFLTFDTSQMLGRLMSRAEVKHLGETLGVSPELQTRFAAIHPKDVWAEQALPALSRWLAGVGQPLNVPREAGLDADQLASAGTSGEYLSLPMLINGLRRADICPRKRLCVLATARNEGVYLIDWIAHHRALGVEHFFLYTNDNTDGSEVLIDALCTEGVVTAFHNETAKGERPQYKAYGHALQVVPEILDYDWVATIDLDEYINFDSEKFNSFYDYLAWQETSNADSIGLSWRVFGPSRQTRWLDHSVYQRFPNYSESGNPHIKSIFRPQAFIHTQCHYPFGILGDPRKYRTGDGKISKEGPFNDTPDYNFAWIDHFYYKSIEEFLVRRMRNHADGLEVFTLFDEKLMRTDMVAAFLQEYAQDTPLRKATNDHLKEKSQAEVDRLMANPKIAAAYQACLKGFALEIRKATDTITAAKRFHEEVLPEGQLLRMLKESEDE